MAQDCSCHQSRVLDANLVMLLIALAQPAQDADGVLDAGLADVHRLEAALQRCVFFDVLAIFVERCCANRVELAAGQHWLQHVAGVHGAFRRARADHGVQLIDKQNDLAG